jgi:pyruvate/2-oxoglutarate dehydrogenase complex dihydrolipoamide dehydrogenase (E3) component
VARAASDKSRAGSVVTDKGTKLEADLVVLGMGVKPRTDYVQDNAEITVEKNGSINVDKYFKIESVKQGNAYAVGDIASYIDGNTGERSSVQVRPLRSSVGIC